MNNIFVYLTVSASFGGIDLFLTGYHGLYQYIQSCGINHATLKDVDASRQREEIIRVKF